MRQRELFPGEPRGTPLEGARANRHVDAGRRRREALCVTRLARHDDAHTGPSQRRNEFVDVPAYATAVSGDRGRVDE